MMTSWQPHEDLMTTSQPHDDHWRPLTTTVETLKKNLSDSRIQDAWRVSWGVSVFNDSFTSACWILFMFLCLFMGRMFVVCCEEELTVAGCGLADGEMRWKQSASVCVEPVRTTRLDCGSTAEMFYLQTGLRAQWTHTHIQKQMLHCKQITD